MWHSIHAHRHDGDLDPLILDAVRPLFRATGGQVTAASFVRHWRRGPHVRLHFRCDRDVFDEVVLPAAEQIVGSYLAALPPATAPDVDQLLPLHQRLAALELEPGPLVPWQPDRTLSIEPYDDRVEVLGSRTAADLLARYLAEATPHAFEMIEWVRAGGQRLRLAFDLMVAVAHGLSGYGVLGGFASYRSHAEAFLCGWPEGSDKRDEWDRHFRRHADRLVERVGDVVAALDGDGPRLPFVDEWVNLLSRYQQQGHALIVAGELSVDTTARTRAALGATRPLTEVSEYHREVYRDEWWMSQVNSSSGFAAYRLVLNYNYLQLTRIGITPFERALLCHLAACAVEQRYGVTALELVRQRYAHPLVRSRRPS